MERRKVSRETRESFGGFVRRRRQKLGLGIREIQRMSNGIVKAPYLSRIEHGRENPPGPEVLTQLAKILQMDRDELFAMAKRLPPDYLEAYLDEEMVRLSSESPEMILKRPSNL